MVDTIAVVWDDDLGMSAVSTATPDAFWFGLPGCDGWDGIVYRVVVCDGGEIAHARGITDQDVFSFPVSAHKVRQMWARMEVSCQYHLSGQ